MARTLDDIDREISGIAELMNQRADRSQGSSARARLEQLEKERFEAVAAFNPELRPFTSVAEAVEHHALRKLRSFDEAASSEHNTDHLGRRRFCVGDQKRTVFIIPHGSVAGYTVDLRDHGDRRFEFGVSYSGSTESLELATACAISWYCDRWEIAHLHEAFPWIDPHPIEIFVYW